jgi:cytochrome oxidase Cu insertion factor (SCO1/SenC/PrrC family)
MRRLLVLTLAFALLASPAVVLGCGSGDDSSSGTTAAGGGSTSPAADFSGTTLDGQDVSLASFAGKPLVLVFWGSW